MSNVLTKHIINSVTLFFHKPKEHLQTCLKTTFYWVRVCWASTCSHTWNRIFLNKNRELRELLLGSRQMRQINCRPCHPSLWQRLCFPLSKGTHLFYIHYQGLLDRFNISNHLRNHCSLSKLGKLRQLAHSKWFLMLQFQLPLTLLSFKNRQRIAPEPLIQSSDRRDQ